MESTILGRLALGLEAISVTVFFVHEQPARFLYRIPVIKLWLPDFLRWSYKHAYSKGFVVVFALAAGIVGLTALIIKGERSWLVWRTILPTILLVAYSLLSFLCAILMNVKTQVNVPL